GAFPCLSEEVSPVADVKESKSRSKPSFSSVAAGRREERKEAKERKSYAQTLKQNNGEHNFYVLQLLLASFTVNLDIFDSSAGVLSAFHQQK
ncbi:unnamed protein product, partial [Brugia timori]|uniref:AF4/FMR2 family, member 2 n=1 Tax=Brugia timori TaxID=42155 RepID=A0A0R3R874_9BILA